MRLRLLLIPLTIVTGMALVAAACGGGSETGGREGAADEDAESLGLVAPDTFLTFEGQLYRLTDTLQANLIDDEFTAIGTATKADIDFEGDLTVFRREGDDEAVYTFSPPAREEETTDLGQPGGEATEDLRIEDDEPGQVIAEAPPGRATDPGEGPAIGTGSGSASGDDVAIDSGEGRTIVHERPDEEPPEEEPSDVILDSTDIVDAEESVISGFWLRWEPEP